MGNQRGPNAFEIATLLANSRISETFNVDRLRPFYIDYSREQAPPPPIRVLRHPGTQPVVEYEVLEKILDWRKNKVGTVEFLVKWVGLSGKDDSTWETRAALAGAKNVLSDTILEPQNDKLAYLIHWPRQVSTVGKTTKRPQRKSRSKGTEPTEKSSRLLTKHSDLVNADTTI